MATVHRPKVLLGTSSDERAVELRRALELQGLDGRHCSDRNTFEQILADTEEFSAVVVEPQDHDGDCLHFLADQLDLKATWPVTIAILTEAQRHKVPEAVSLGVDLPLVGDGVEPKDLAVATAQIIERRVEESAANSQWQLDAVSWEVIAPQSNGAVRLTFKEREFLLKLADQPGQPVPKEEFVALFGTTPELFDPRRLEIMVRRLRNKVREKTNCDLPLHTAYGLGYALAAPVLIVENPPSPRG